MTPKTDLIGRPLTALETQVAALHDAIEALARRSDLPPCIAGNVRHALACSWQMMNDLDLPCQPPDDAAP